MKNFFHLPTNLNNKASNIKREKKLCYLSQAQLTEEALRTLKDIEHVAYKNTNYAMMQHYTTWEDVADYCDCNLHELRVYLNEDWYVLLAEHEDYIEFVDLASKVKTTPLSLIVNTILEYKKPFLMDCRENTSYRMLKALEKAGRIEVSQDDSYSRGGETFHEVRCIPKDKEELKQSQSTTARF